MLNFSEDYLLDKQVKIFQPLNGYRASTDAVILSSLIAELKKDASILDVGSGTGAISLCLAERFKNIRPLITGLELQPELVELSNQSAQANGFADFLSFLQADISDKKTCPKPCSFSHVITNPPYSEHDMPSPNASKAFAHNGKSFKLSEWIAFCIKMLRPQGYFYMINRAEALPEILACLHGKLGEINIFPLYSKPCQKAKRVIISARKDSKAAAIIHQSLIIHDPDGSYNQTAHKILRQGLSLKDAFKD